MVTREFLKQWQGLRKFQALSTEFRSVVFYAEDGGSWRYFEPILRALAENHEQRVCYITSSSKDPVLQREDPWIEPIFIGSGTARTLLFLSLSANVLVMTMPDLQTYYIKRSRHPVHYVYVHHSMVSSHMAYRRGAFDNFDSILCVGPHHEREARATEEAYSLKPKTLVQAGYGILDSVLCSKTSAEQTDPSSKQNSQKEVLVAPTWGKHSLLEECGNEVVETLLSAGNLVTVRPHPMSRKTSAKALAVLNRKFTDHPAFKLDLSPQSQGVVDNADIMVTDWSGTALEFAFGLERPVIYIDLPKKINNQEYQTIPWQPVEVSLREQLGPVVPPDRLSELTGAVADVSSANQQWVEKIRKLRDQYVYNVGHSGTVGAAYIANLARSV